MNIKNLLIEFIKDESGLTAVEYAIAGGLVVGGMVTAFISLGTGADVQIQKLSDCVAGGGSAGEGTC